MKFLFTFIFGFLFICASSQVTDYFEGNPKWRMSWSNGAQMPCLELHEYIYYLNGDSIVEDTTYHKVFERRELDYEWMAAPPPNNCEGSWFTDEFLILIRQEGLKMFVRNNEGIDTLLYNFDLQVGDTLPLSYNLFIDTVIVSGIDSLLVGSSYRKVFEIPDYNPAGNNLIEGIGFTTGLLDDFYCPEFPTILECFVQNDTTYYPGFGEPCDLTVSIPDPINEGTISYFPNPVNDVMTVAVGSTFKISKIYCLSPDGRLLDLGFKQKDNEKIIVDFSGVISGVYVLHIQTSEGSVMNIKVLKI